ncbi:MAG: Nif11-like leader peptide family natural product precursor [Atopobiaceae bacterium]|nr:Nif11-like leader peptide family natural product precursor [Atopobiaceae bacterium]
MTENAKKFLEVITNNEELRLQIEAIDDSDKDAAFEQVIAIAKERGFELTLDDLKTAGAKGMTDDELDAMAGSKRCYCALGGGGVAQTRMKDGKEYGDGTCACVVGGLGNRVGENSNGKWLGPRCMCLLGGGGESYN